ncbi:MAG TPA: biotin-dependent carboxyltransferase family protein [Devosia sp.]|nr:biotin-dependent carboxyltransferase family protein [Devosia sp.]
MTSIEIIRAGPLATLQDRGRFGMLKHGISASGPMDGGAFEGTGAMLAHLGSTAIEFTSAGLSVRVDGTLELAGGGGAFAAKLNGLVCDWPLRLDLKSDDVVEITPGVQGNYGYLRFDCEIDVASVLGSRATNVTVGLGGYDGRALRTGDVLSFGAPGKEAPRSRTESSDGPIRVTWGLHADRIDADMRADFAQGVFVISDKLDRMGVRLTDLGGIFAGLQQLSLVSDAIVPGDIQILGDGTPIVLMRDHQPTGGYPRIATIVSADLDRFAQMRPGTEVRFQPVMLDHLK